MGANVLIRPAVDDDWAGLWPFTARSTCTSCIASS